MAEFIILTKEEADMVAGQGLYGQAMNPLKRAGDVYVLSSVVLDNPAFAPWVEMLKDKPKLESDAEGFPGPFVEPPPEEPCDDPPPVEPAPEPAEPGYSEPTA